MRTPEIFLFVLCVLIWNHRADSMGPVHLMWPNKAGERHWVQCHGHKLPYFMAVIGNSTSLILNSFSIFLPRRQFFLTVMGSALYFWNCIHFSHRVFTKFLCPHAERVSREDDRSNEKWQTVIYLIDGIKLSFVKWNILFTALNLRRSVSQTIRVSHDIIADVSCTICKLKLFNYLLLPITPFSITSLQTPNIQHDWK